LNDKGAAPEKALSVGLTMCIVIDHGQIVAEPAFPDNHFPLAGQIDIA
jgi:hypothetical protein